MRVLQQVPFFAENMTDEEFERLYSKMSKVEVRAGEVLIRTGDRADTFFIIQSGVVEVREDLPADPSSP